MTEEGEINAGEIIGGTWQENQLGLETHHGFMEAISAV